MVSHNRGVNPTSHIELRRDTHESWLDCSNKVAQDLICDGFVKRALIAIRPHIEFQGFELNTERPGNVFQEDGGKIRLPRFRAQAGEFRDSDPDRVVSIRIGVVEGLQFSPRALF